MRLYEFEEETVDATTLKLGPPFPAQLIAGVKAMQQGLEQIGYDVGSTGIDGKYGPRTARAVAAFKKDYRVNGDGNSFDNTAKDVLNKVISGAIPRVAQPTMTTHQANAKAGAGATPNARTAYNYFRNKGWSPAQAAGIVGNLQAESGANLNDRAVGDGGKAYGIAQWHPDRQQSFARAMGKDIRSSSLGDQLAFIHWELNNSEARAGRKLKSAQTAAQAAWIVDEYYERSAGIHRTQRMDNAVALLTD